MLFDTRQLHDYLFEDDDFHIEKSEGRNGRDSQHEEAGIQMKHLVLTFELAA